MYYSKNNLIKVLNLNHQNNHLSIIRFLCLFQSQFVLLDLAQWLLYTAEEIEILSKDVEIDGEIYTLSSNIKYKTNCITETSTSISVDEDGEIDTNTSWSERFKSKSSLSIHGIEVPYNLFPDYSNRMSKAVLKIPFPFSFRLDIGVNSDLNLNSARDQIIYDEKWLTFEENLYRIICRRLKDILSSSDWKILNEIIQKNNTDTFCRVANSFE